MSNHSPEQMSNDLVVSSEDPLAQDHSSDMTIATDNVVQGMGDGVKKASKVKKKYKKKFSRNNNSSSSTTSICCFNNINNNRFT
jgi:hypothetical protein